jgi:conjugative relaxase-like TrwC/TraI family protein
VGRQRRAVAGYDLVFTPVKSVSLRWALGGPGLRAAVEDAHHAAVADVLGWLEREACFTRAGDHGELVLDTYGLVAAAFDHRESRLGNPDLHTHVAIANKVRARIVDGSGRERWLALDGRALYAAGVAASERYNTRLEDEVPRRTGVSFAARGDTVRRDARPVREVVGVPTSLVRALARRRGEIETAITSWSGTTGASITGSRPGRCS